MSIRRLARRFRPFLIMPSTVVAAVWTAVAVHRARRSLRQQGFATRVPRPPRLPWQAGRGVSTVLGRLDRTCLERAMVEQAWLVGQGKPLDIVIGVTAECGDVKAHAWVDGRADLEAGGYKEIYRITPDSLLR